MKIITIIVQIFLIYVLAIAEKYVKVTIQDEQDIHILYKQGFKFEDVKVKEKSDQPGHGRLRFVYNFENYYVTVRVSEGQIEKLQEIGYTVEEIIRSDIQDFIPLSTNEQTIPYQLGWPRSTYNGMSLYENSPTVADMNGDDKLDVSVTNAWGSFNPTVPPYVIVWQRNGTFLLGFPSALQPGILQSSADAGISAMGDIYGDDHLEIVCGDENGFLYAFDDQGLSLNGFPVHYGYYTGVFTPALADLNGDGKAEIIVISHNWDSPYGNAYLHVLTVTDNGPVERSGFPVSLEKGTGNSPAVGDLDGDGDFEIVVGTGGTTDLTIEAKIIAFSDSGQILPGFPWVVGKNSVGNSPTLFDLNSDGTLEILIRVKPDYNNINGIYALDYQGNLLPGFPFPIEYGNPTACVAVGDIDGDLIPEVAYGGVEAVDSAKVWVYALNGNLLPGYPAKVYRTWVDGSVAIADVDGDGVGDVVCGTNGTSSKPGMIRAFNYLGQEVNGFPLMPGNPILTSFETHPTLIDIDNDGDTEIFAGRVDQNVYCWDTPGVYDSLTAWQTFKGNAGRTGGQKISPTLVNLPSIGKNQMVPQEYRLTNYPNPFNPLTTIEFNLSRGEMVSLVVYNLSGEEIKKIVNYEMLQAGKHRYTFEAENLTTGVYFYQLKAESVLKTGKMVLLK
ncbi:MAG: T9SS type A sorting domain-containing protein [bacterium]|nr:MAG: T9SS type A sorting domain-containing protein [bacterium]